MRPKAWKSLILKSKYLSTELEDYQDIISQHETEFNQMVQNAISQSNPIPHPPQTPPPDIIPYNQHNNPSPNSNPNNSQNNSSQPQEPNQDPIPDIIEPKNPIPDPIKKIWKSIASQTHPDKTNNQIELSNIYKQAAQAYQQQDFKSLIKIAIDLNLNIPMEESIIHYLNDSIQHSSNQISNIKQTIIWHWIHADPKQKNMLIQHLIKNMK